MADKQFIPVKRLAISEDEAGQRIDNFLFCYLKTMPKTRIYRLLRKGEIRVNKKRTDPSYRLQAGDEIRLPPMGLEQKAALPLPSHRAEQELNEAVLYQDKGLLIINKPSGLPVHGGARTPLGVVEILKKMHPEWPQLELAHRLDLETSGVLILAKKRSVLREIHGLLREGKVHKIYWALTLGQWQEAELTVDVPLSKNHLSSGERIVRVDQDGKEALTVFTTLEKFQGASLMEVRLHTGRTHQIRVHARYRKHPLAGDVKYGDKDFNQMMRDLGLRRLFLHAKRIEFYLESTGQTIRVEAPLDPHLATCLKKLGSGTNQDLI